MLIYYAKPRFRKNELRIENGNIIIQHSDKVKEVSDVDLVGLRYDLSSKNDYVSDLLVIDKGYCPKYLKNIIQSLRVKDLSEEQEEVYKDFEKEMKDKWRLLLSLYQEDELSQIILKFGNSIWKLIKRDYNNTLDLIINNEYKTSFNRFNEKLTKVAKGKLQAKIDKLIKNIGVPVIIDKDDKNNRYSTWNEFIYNAVLLYLYKEEASNPNIINIISAYLNKINENEMKQFSKNMKILRRKTDTKRVEIINYLIPFLIIYMDNHYGPMKYYHEFGMADHWVDILEEHRDYLLSRAKNERKIDNIRNYSYNSLRHSYDRKILKY